jgi:hypothetical protein
MELPSHIAQMNRLSNILQYNTSGRVAAAFVTANGDPNKIPNVTVISIGKH